MMQKRLFLLLLTTALIVTGCVGAMVNAQLNRHTVKPDISQIGANTINDADFIFYYDVLKNYDNYFSNLAERPLNEEEKAEFTRRMKAKESEFIVQFEANGMNKIDAMRTLKNLLRTEKNQQKNSYRPKALPEGAAWGRIVTATEIAVGEADLLFDNAYAGYFYPAETNEEAVQLRRALYEKMAGLGFAAAGWSVGGLFSEAYVQAQPEIDRMLMYAYTWESTVINKSINLPHTDMLQFQFLVEKENAEYKPGVYVLASLTINKEEF